MEAATLWITVQQARDADGGTQAHPGQNFTESCPTVKSQHTYHFFPRLAGKTFRNVIFQLEQTNNKNVIDKKSPKETM